MSTQVKDVIVGVLKAIRDSQKKLKVKTSKHLKKLEYFLFETNKQKLSGDDFKLLLLGNDDMGLPYGLLFCCGSKSKLDGNLRKSSYYTAKLLVRILELHPQRKECVAMYCDLEEDDFKLMSLSTHILADNQNDMAAFQLIRIVKDKRPYLNLSTLVDGRRVIEKFETWYKDYRKVQVEEEIKQTTWVDEDGKQGRQSEEDAYQQRDENHLKKLKMLEHIQLNQSDKSAGFMIKTFQDPLQMDYQRQQSDPSKKLRAQKRKQITNLMTLQVIPQSSIDNTRRKLLSNGYVMEDVIFKLHIDSDEFDPNTLIQGLHNDTPTTQFTVMLLKLQNECLESKNLTQTLLYFFFEDLFILKNGITKLQVEFVKREYESYQQRKRGGDTLMVVDEDLILGRLRLKNLMLLKELNVIAKNLNEVKKNQFQLRQCLVFLQKFENLVRLPQEIKKAYVQQDYKQIVYLYLQNKHHIKKFQNLSIFSQLFQEITSNLTLTFREVIQSIRNEVNDFGHLIELVTILLDLPPDECGQVTEQQGVGSIHPNALTVIQAISKQLMSESSLYMDNEQPTKTEQINIEKVQGDMINEFLLDMGVVVKKTEKKKAGKNAIVLNCKAVEKYFQNKFLNQFTNFYSLCMKFQSGELDYRMGIQKREQDQPQWTALLLHTYKELVDHFLLGFDTFMSRLQSNWFEDEEVGKESTQFYNRVKSDLKTMSSVLFHYEQILLATKFQVANAAQQRVLTSTKKQKTDMLVLFMKILFEEYRNITLNQLSLGDTNIPQQDFFGVQISTYVTDIFDAILSTFQALSTFALHEGLFQSNSELFISYFMQLLQQALLKIKSTYLILSNADEEHRSIYRTRCLIFLHNLRIILPQSKSNLLKELVDNVHHMLSVHCGRQSEYSTNMTKILNSLKQNNRQARKQCRQSIISLYGAPMSSSKFQNALYLGVTQLIESIYNPTLQLYISYLAPEFQLPKQQLITTTPRPYLYEWLDLVNQQVSQASMLHPVDPLLMDTLSAFVCTLFFKVMDSTGTQDSQPQWSALALEIQFYESMTVRLHGKMTKEGILKLYNSLKSNAKVQSIEDLFEKEQDVSTRQDLLRNAKYKVQYNFKALFVYF